VPLGYKSRGTKVINNTFANGFKNACVVHDNYSSYSSLECKSEELCLVHKLRDLNYAIESDDTMLAKGLKQLLKEAIRDDREGLTQEQRAIRNIKVKQKVSGQFKSFEGAIYYSNIKSIVETSRKRGLNESESLTRMIERYSVF